MENEQILKPITYNSLLEEIKYLEPGELIGFWIATVGREVSAILGLSSYQSLDINHNFFEMGMTSLMLIELQERLQNILGELLYISDSVVFDYSSIKLLANYLLTNVQTPH